VQSMYSMNVNAVAAFSELGYNGHTQIHVHMDACVSSCNVNSP